MDFALAAGDKKDFEDAFRPPFDWSRQREDEALRGWRTLDASPRALHLMHGTGAVAVFTLNGDRVTTVELLEGAAAEAVVRASAGRTKTACKYASRLFCRMAAMINNDEK